jgi:soluble lytic murein transglycosylase-like protein
MTTLQMTTLLLTSLLATSAVAGTACDEGPVRAEAARWGRVFRVPPSWIVSIAWAESRFCPHAENESGATGVLQVKLSRARDLVRWIERSAWRTRAEVLQVLAGWRGLRDDLRDVALCVMLAAFDLHRLVRKFGRNHDVVVAAYNQGEGAVGRCLRDGGPLPPRAVEFIARVRRARGEVA